MCVPSGARSDEDDQYSLLVERARSISKNFSEDPLKLCEIHQK